MVEPVGCTSDGATSCPEIVNVNRGLSRVAVRAGADPAVGLEGLELLLPLEIP